LSADIINLRRVRKDKARAQQNQKAAENRVLFGETKAQKSVRKAEAERVVKRIEAGRIEPSKDD
jgi:hypothetical protein